MDIYLNELLKLELFNLQVLKALTILTMSAIIINPSMVLNKHVEHGMRDSQSFLLVMVMQELKLITPFLEKQRDRLIDYTFIC